MSLNFQNNHLLWLLALALVPLLLHLFARTKPPKYQFSSVEFLRKIVRKTMRLRKPQDIILLILRTLAVLALIGVFLRPLLFSNEKLRGLFEKKNLVVIVDSSASMAYVEGAQTRFASACAEASEILSGLTNRDRANVIWLKAEPESVFPEELGSNIEFLREQLRRATVTHERGATEKAFSLAKNLLANSTGDGKQEICVVSDFQRTGWENFNPTLPENIDLIHVKIGNRDADNQALVALDFNPKRPVVGESFAITAEVENFSTEEVQTTIFSEVGESRRSENIVVPAGQRTSVSIRHKLTQAGTFPVKVSLAEDSFPGDDNRALVVDVRPHLRVGVLDSGDPETAKMWTRAAQSLGWAVPELLDEAADDLAGGKANQFDALFLAGWSDESESEISPDTKVIFLPEKNNITPESAADGKPFQLKIAKPDDALFDLFREGDHGSLDGIVSSARWKPSPEFDTGEVLLSWSDGQTALSRLAPNRYAWLIPLSGEPGNLAGRVEFVPFIGELLLSDRGTSMRVSDANNSVDFETGDVVLWSAPNEVSEEDLSAVGPGESVLPFRAEPGGRFSTGPIAVPGVVEWKSEGAPIGYSAVNFPVVESNLTTLEIDEVENTASAAVEAGSAVRNLRDGINLWPWLLGAAVIFLLLEAGVMLWAARTV